MRAWLFGHVAPAAGLEWLVHPPQGCAAPDALTQLAVISALRKCKAAEGKWLGNNKKGNCYEKTWCEQFSKDKKGCKKAKVGAKKVCKYKKAKVAKNEKKARDATCVIKKKSKAP